MDEKLILKIKEFNEESEKLVKEYKEKHSHSNGNILDCLNLKETDHSSILAGILNFYSNGEPENLKYFLELIEHKFGAKTEIYQYLKNSKIYTEKMNIDCLITDDKNFAIIIENKINFAVDQDKQIERYIDSVMNNYIDIKAENIYVVYLTKDGSKEIEDYSFTDNAKKNLGYKNNNESGRFIKLNYKDDILPWLNATCMEVRNKDHLFIEFLDQYIDKLNGEFGFREIDKGETTIMIEQLYKTLNIDNKNNIDKVKELTNLRGEIDEMYKAIDYAIKAIIDPLFISTFGNIITKEFNNIEPASERKDTFFQIYIKDENIKHDFHFELMFDVDVANIEFIKMYLHDETIDKVYKKMLLDDKDFMKIATENNYKEGKNKSDVIYKEINFNNKLIDVIEKEDVPRIMEAEYKIVDDMAKYIIEKIKK